MKQPQKLMLPRRTLDVSAYAGRGAADTDCATLLTEPSIIVDEATQQVMLVYLVPIAEDTRVLVDALRHVRVGWHHRTNGMRSRARVVGYQPRNPRHNPYCSSAALATEDPAGHAVVCSFASVVARYYQQYGPAVYAAHEATAASVLPEWRLEGTAFTSGIVNRDNPLPYHYDAGNFKGGWSGMLGFKRGVRGGHLAVPEYDVALEIGDKSLLLFDGQGLLHGVTPFWRARGGYRDTIVYYSLQQMWQCLPPEQEVARVQRLRLERG